MRLKLKEIAEIKPGFQLRKKILMSDTGDFKIIQSKDINKITRELESTSLYMTDIRNPEKYFVRKGDILVQARGEHYPPTMVQADLPNTTVSSQYYIVRITSDIIIPKFLYHSLEQDSTQNSLRNLASGTTIKMIHIDGLRNLTLNIPSLVIQNKMIELAELVKKEVQLSDLLTYKRNKMLNVLFDIVNTGE